MDRQVFGWLPVPVWLACVGALIMVPMSPLSLAQQSTEIDQLTQRWLQLEQQSSQLQHHWQEQKLLLEQRLTLLTAQKQQLQKVLLERQGHSSQADTRRAELLTQQEQLEVQQANMQQTLDRLTSKTKVLSQILPPPLLASWEKEAHIPSEPQDSSTALQVALAQLSLLADFNRRVSVHSSTLQAPNGQAVVVKQLYLGVGMAWFASEDGQHAGWGQAGEDHWLWHFDQQLSGQSVLDAIAMHEKRLTADWVELPFHLPTPNTHDQLSGVSP